MSEFFTELTVPLAPGAIFTGATHNVGPNERKFIVMASAEYGEQAPAGHIISGCSILIEQSSDGIDWRTANHGVIPSRKEGLVSTKWETVSADLAMKKVRVTVRNTAFSTLISLAVHSRLC